MTYALTPYTGGGVARDSRRGSRELSGIETSGLLRQTAIDVEVEVATTKIAARTAATGEAVAALGRVAQAVTAVEQLIPQTSGRLALISDHHTLAVASYLERLDQRLRRL